MSIPLPALASITAAAFGPGDVHQSSKHLGNPVGNVVDRRREQITTHVLGAALRCR